MVQVYLYDFTPFNNFLLCNTKASIISAEGDAQAAELLAKAFADAGDGLVELRRIEAAEDIAYQLSRSRQVAYLPAGQSTLLNLPTMN